MFRGEVIRMGLMKTAQRILIRKPKTETKIWDLHPGSVVILECILKQYNVKVNSIHLSRNIKQRCALVKKVINHCVP